MLLKETKYGEDVIVWSSAFPFSPTVQHSVWAEVITGRHKFSQIIFDEYFSAGFKPFLLRHEPAKLLTRFNESELNSVLGDREDWPLWSSPKLITSKNEVYNKKKIWNLNQFLELFEIQIIQGYKLRFL